MSVSKKVFPAAMLGNVLEWYDYALYGHVAVILSNRFFPGDDPVAKLLATYGVFAIGFLARPFGGVFFGYIGDRYGRKKALALAILMMAVPTGFTGILPTYASIGISASILLTLIRLVQGFSLGGEHSGTVIYLTEHAPAGKKGLFGSTGVACAAVGVLLASLTVNLISHIFGQAAFEEWGWRVAFIIGIFIGISGLYLRLYCDESPEFLKAEKEDELLKMPLATVFHDHWRILVSVVFIIMQASITFFIVGFYFGTLNSHLLGFTESQALTVAAINLSLFAISMPLGGIISDRIGRKRMARIALIMLAVLAYPLFFMSTQTDILISATGQALFTIASGLYVGVAVTLGVESFPPNVRYTGNGIAHNISTALFGGTTPMIFLWFAKFTSEPPASMTAYIVIASLLGIYAIAEKNK